MNYNNNLIIIHHRYKKIILTSINILTHFFVGFNQIKETINQFNKKNWKKCKINFSLMTYFQRLALIL